MNAKPTRDTPARVRGPWDYATRCEPNLVVWAQKVAVDVNARDSTQDEDLRGGKDFVIERHRLTFAFRVRRLSNVGYCRDFTLRAAVRSGSRTEMDKLRRESADLYVYGFFDDLRGDRLDTIAVVDMQRFLNAGLLSLPDGVKRTNEGDAKFAYWCFDGLRMSDSRCVVHYEHFPLESRLPPKCDGHVDMEMWVDVHLPNGQIRTECRKCGQFIGYRR